MDEPTNDDPADHMTAADHDALHRRLSALLCDALRGLPCGYVLITTAAEPDGVCQMVSSDVEPDVAQDMIAAASAQVAHDGPATPPGRPS